MVKPMADVIVIYHLNPGSGSKPIYTVRYVRFKHEVDIGMFKQGLALQMLKEQGCVEENGLICFPDGAPPREIDQGTPTIGSKADAIGVARAALANPNSEVRTKGFSEATPIYFLPKVNQRSN